MKFSRIGMGVDSAVTGQSRVWEKVQLVVRMLEREMLKLGVYLEAKSVLLHRKRVKT